MSDTFHEQSVKASRKVRRCDWCGELINIGQSYESYRWRDGSDGGTVVMHPECLQAMGRTSDEEGGDGDVELMVCAHAVDHAVAILQEGQQ